MNIAICAKCGKSATYAVTSRVRKGGLVCLTRGCENEFMEVKQ